MHAAAINYGVLQPKVTHNYIIYTSSLGPTRHVTFSNKASLSRAVVIMFIKSALCVRTASLWTSVQLSDNNND